MTFTEFLMNEPDNIKNILRLAFFGFDDLTQVRVISPKSGYPLMHQGDAKSNVFVLLEGSVSVFTQHSPNNTYTLRELHPISFLGEQEALANYPNLVATIKTKSACRLLVIKKSDYMRWVMSDTDIILKRMRVAMSALLRQGAQDRTAIFLSSCQRLALFLMDYYERNVSGKQADAKVIVKMSRTAISENLGFSSRTVNRCIDKFVKNGNIGLQRGKITITGKQYYALEGVNLNS